MFGTLAQGAGPQMSPLAFLMLMAVSLLSSLFIAYLYVHFYSNRATGSQVHRTFPLLDISARLSSSPSSFRCRCRWACSALSRSFVSGRRSRNLKRSASSCWSSLYRSRRRRSNSRLLELSSWSRSAPSSHNHSRAASPRGSRWDNRDFPSRKWEIIRPGGYHGTASQAVAEGDARKRVTERSRNGRVVQLPGNLRQRRLPDCRRSSSRRGPIHLQRLLQPAGRAVNADLRGGDPFVAAHRCDRGDLRGSAETRISRPLSHWRFAAQWSPRLSQALGGARG